MNIETAILERRSIRAFKNDPVPQELVNRIIELSLRSPSWGNTQPWEVLVVMGEKVHELKEGFRSKFERDEPPNPDIPLPTDWPADCLNRYKSLGRDLFRKIGIRREDRESRRNYYLSMFQGFGAPVFIYVCLDRKLSQWALLDVGLFVQTVCLAATSAKLGTCILTHLVLYPDVIRKHLEVPNTKLIVIGIALGYTDKSALINTFRSPRVDMTEIVKWFK